MLAIQHHLRGLALFGAIVTSLASPVAGLFLAIVATSWALSSRSRRIPGLAIAFAACLPIGIITLLFPDPGPFPYYGWGLVRDLSVCALFIFAMKGPYKPMRWGAVVYAAVLIITFLVPTALGGNVSRLGQYVGAPLIACALWSQRRIVIVAMVLPMVLWQWVPAMSAVAWSGHDPSTTKAYYQPLVNYINNVPGVPGRIEIPFTYRHWETAYVAPEVPLARGWERQLDIERNPLFYDEDPNALNALSYYGWLLDNAVEYVALPNTALDSSAIAERQLLQSNLPYLHKVWSNPDWQLWRFDGYPGMIEGSATVLGMDADSFRLIVYKPGTVIVRVRPVVALAGERSGLRERRRVRLDSARERAHRSRRRVASGVRRVLSVSNVVGVVLGAGASTRLGRPKQSLPLGDRTLLGHVVADVEAALFTRSRLRRAGGCCRGSRRRVDAETVGRGAQRLVRRRMRVVVARRARRRG